VSVQAPAEAWAPPVGPPSPPAPPVQSGSAAPGEGFGDGGPLTAYVWPTKSASALLVLTLALNLVAGFAARSVLKVAWGAPIETLAVGAILLLSYAVQLGTLWVVARRHGYRLTESVGLRGVTSPVAWFGSALAAAATVRVFALLYSAFMISTGLKLQGWDSSPMRYFAPGPLGSALLVLIVVVVAPIVEEMVFRGVVLTSIRARWGDTVAIGASSFVFAAMHISLFSFLPIFAVAVVLSALFIKSKSLWVSIACHSAFNGVGVVFLLVLRARSVV